jgi:ribosomal protein S18 acetylase RimI-like enzyme
MELVDIIKYVKKHGFLQSLKHVFERLGFVSFNRTLIFLVLKFNDIPNDISESYSFHIASTDDIQKEQNYYDSWFTKQEAIKRIQSGHRLFVFERNEKMVYFLWVELNSAAIGYFDIRFHISDDMVYLTGAYTLPEFRNRGIASKLKKEIFHYLKKEGFNDMIGVVDPLNTTALGIDKRLGFKEYQTINYKRYWHIRHYNVQKYNSDERKTFITLFKAPKDIWKTFL